MKLLNDFLKQLGKPDELWRKSKEMGALSPLPANTHIHLPPNFSAFQSVQQAIQMAQKEGIRVLGAGNYYDFRIYEDFVRQCLSAGIFPLVSTETIAFEPPLAQANCRVNDPGNPGKIYLCGKAISRIEPMSEKAAALMEQIRQRDAARMKVMIDKMSDVFNAAGIPIKLTEKQVVDSIVKRHQCPAETITLQERHLAQAFQEAFFQTVPEEQRADALTKLYGTSPKAALDDPVGTQNDIRTFLMKAGKSCFEPESFGRLEEAKTLIAQLGGIACYPVLADGSPTICEYETPLADLTRRLCQEGYTMVEFIPIRNSAAVLTEYATAVRAAGIVLTAGTEHNTLDLIPLTPTCKGKTQIPDQLNRLFWEGVCVCAAHLFLEAHGQPGFVENDGKPNRQFSNAFERIEAFARLGQTVLNAFYKRVER